MSSISIAFMNRIIVSLNRARAAAAFLLLCVILYAAPAAAEGWRVPCGDQRCTIYRVDLTTQRLELLYKDERGERLRNAAGLEKWGATRGRKLVFATNAGIFTTRSTPLGLFVIDGKELAPLNLNDGVGNFFLKPNGVFVLESDRAKVVKSREFTPSPAVRLACQSGPLLVVRDEIHPLFTKGSSNLNVRSGVGVRSETEVLFAISDGPVSLYDFAELFRSTLHCPSALYLDGYISQMFLPELGRMERGGDFAGMFAVFE